MDKVVNYFKKPIFATLASILTFVFAFYLSILQDQIGTYNLAIAATLTTFISILSIFIYSSYSKSNVEQEFDEKVVLLEDFIKASALGKIINEETLSKMEEQAEEIWIVSQSLINETREENQSKEHTMIYDIIKENLTNNKHYLYFLPDTKEVKGVINSFKKIYNSVMKPEQVEFCLIPVDEFHFINDIIVYDVTKLSKKTEALFSLPNDKLFYYYALDQIAKEKLIGTLELLKEKYDVKY